MVRRRFAALCLVVLAMGNACAAGPDVPLASVNTGDQQAELDLLSSAVKAAIDARNFGTLTAMEQEFRTSRARTVGGTWKLASLHSALQFYLADGLEPESGCEFRDAPFVDAWRAEAPSSPGPAITEAALLLAQAWCIRGGDYASKVPDAAWPRFRSSVSAASAALDRAAEAASADPEYYVVKLDSMRASGADRAAFRAMMDEGATREPYYYAIYSHAAWFYLPQWGGSYDEVETLARDAAKRTSGEDGMGAYARIFSTLDECGCKIISTAANWPTMKQAMRDWYNRYPTRWLNSYAADLMCRMGDSDEGHRYIRAAHPEAQGDDAFLLLFNQCDSRPQREG